MAKKTPRGEEFIPCSLKSLTEGKSESKAESMAVKAAKTAVEINPANQPAPSAVRLVARLVSEVAAACRLNASAKERPVDEPSPSPLHIAMVTTKYWGSSGVNLGVYFMDTQDSALKNKILQYMNKWGKYGNVKFSEAAAGSAQVRLARQRGGGYWSYLGTDILHVGKSYPTMNLDSFSVNTPESEYDRVVCHETGHTLGFPHEHMRPELVARLDEQKTVLYFQRTQGWSPSETRAQVLTPLDENTLTTLPTDQTSIMCYQLPGSITKDGKPIPGGNAINDEDGQLVTKVYPAPGGGGGNGGGGGGGGNPPDVILEVKKAGKYRLITP